MSMLIAARSFSGVREEFYWKLGEKKYLKFCLPEDILSIQADGDELDEIRLRFDHIPLPKHRNSVIWRGEFAQFIWENL